jgi:hypothetical protein
MEPATQRPARNVMKKNNNTQSHSVLKGRLDDDGNRSFHTIRSSRHANNSVINRSIMNGPRSEIDLHGSRMHNASGTTGPGAYNLPTIFGA